MLELKGCPRCRGDLKTSGDIYGTYRECLQCGYMVDVEKPNALLAASAYRNKEKAA